MAVLDITDIPAAPEGMNQQVKPWHIPDGQCRYLQDALLDKENEINRRGPVKPIATYPTFTDRGIAIVATEDVNRAWRIAVLHGDADESHISPLNTAYTSATELEWDDANGVYFDETKKYKVATSGHPRGGAIIGVQNFAGAKGQTSVGHWGGASNADYSTGTITVSQDGTSVVGSGTTWTTAMAGMFLYAVCDIATGSGKNYLGQVLSVQDTTHLTLVEGSLFPSTARAHKLRSVRPLDLRVAKGTITCTTSAATVDGANTKFKRQGLANDVWVLFRSEDMKYIGKVSSVASDIQLTLTGNADIACNKDKYVAINVKGDLKLQTTDAKDMGWISANFAGRQWYANNPYSNKSQPYGASRVWFSDLFDPEALDHTADGDHLFIPSQYPPIRPITGLAALPQVLVVFKENETYGIYGTDESNFSIHKLDVADGCINPQTIQRYQDGVLWAGEKGVWFFDGEQVFDLTEDRIGDWYEKAMETASTRNNAAASFIYKGNYFLFVDGVSPPTGPDKTENTTGVEAGTPQTYISMAVNLDRRAFSLMTNLSYVGGVVSPNEEGQGTLFLVNKVGDSTPYTLTGARICKAADLFDTDGLDTITCQLNTQYANALGPDFYMESKRYDLGSPQRKKRFKQLQMNYRLDTITGDFVTNGHDGAAGDTDYSTNYLKFGTMVGLNEISRTSSSKWNPTRAKDQVGDAWRAGYQNKRIKFNKRSQLVGFKLWQSNLTGIKKLRIASMALATKPMRPGRV